MGPDGLLAVRVERNVLIPLGDGVSLAGDLFLPDADGSFPALVSYYPYHRDDQTGARHDHPSRYFAARGYASLLVDLRGLGNSAGVAWDPGDPAEATDGAAIVEWAAAQPWCTGDVGMWGMSYGGMTTFKTAAVRPPHLRAIVPMHASLDRYNDIVYRGGCFNCLGLLGGWGLFMTVMNLAAPMYHDRAGRWARIWRERLREARRPYIMPYQEHPTYDEFWRSKRVPAEQIEVPTFLIGSWRDIFPEAMVGAYERIKSPKRLLMGPWMHQFPDTAGSDEVDYLALMLRWWDRWLKGVNNGVEDEPPVLIHVQGRGWRAEDAWPIARAQGSALWFGMTSDRIRTLAERPNDESGEVSYRADPTVGYTAGLWDPTGTGLGFPLDQSPDDVRSISFTGEPLPKGLEITGSPEATIHVALDEGDDVNLVVKLCDVSPEGRSALITTGWIKGSHRLSSQEPSPVPVGALTEFNVPMWATSYWVPAGHRLRVNVACSDFPRIWPSRSNPLIRLAVGGSTPSVVRLPTIPNAQTPEFAVPVPDPTVRRMPLNLERQPRWTIVRDMATDTVTVTTGTRSVLLPGSRDGRFELDRTSRASVSAGRPDGAFVEGEATICSQTPSGAQVVVEGRLRITLDGQDYWAAVTVDGQKVFDQRWSALAPDVDPIAGS